MNHNLYERQEIECIGVEKALRVAQALLENDYDVLIMAAEFDTFIVQFCFKDQDFGASRFMRVSEDEQEHIYSQREFDAANPSIEDLK